MAAWHNKSGSMSRVFNSDLVSTASNFQEAHSRSTSYQDVRRIIGGEEQVFLALINVIGLKFGG